MKLNLKNVLFVLLLALASCSKKNDVKPVGADIIGVWLYNHGEMQFTIYNDRASNYTVKFIDYQSNGRRYLKVVYPDNTQTYIIKHVGEAEMLLTDNKGIDYRFIKY